MLPVLRKNEKAPPYKFAVKIVLCDEYRVCLSLMAVYRQTGDLSVFSPFYIGHIICDTYYVFKYLMYYWKTCVDFQISSGCTCGNSYFSLAICVPYKNSTGL